MQWKMGEKLYIHGADEVLQDGDVCRSNLKFCFENDDLKRPCSVENSIGLSGICDLIGNASEWLLDNYRGGLHHYEGDGSLIEYGDYRIGAKGYISGGHFENNISDFSGPFPPFFVLAGRQIPSKVIGLRVARRAYCDESCRSAWCGDGVVDTYLGESCDDGNKINELLPLRRPQL